MFNEINKDTAEQLKKVFSSGAATNTNQGLGQPLTGGVGSAGSAGAWGGYPIPSSAQHPCPTCGKCPTCGHGDYPYWQYPYYQPYNPYYGPNYYRQDVVYCNSVVKNPEVMSYN
jgi:hypothetical protein